MLITLTTANIQISIMCISHRPNHFADSSLFSAHRQSYEIGSIITIRIL